MAASETTAPSAATVAEAEAGWLRDLRADWEQRLAATPRPTGLEEEWRRTSLDSLPWDAADVAEPPRTTHELPAHLAEAGVVFGDLSDVARDRPELVQRYLGRGETLDSHAHFWALAMARWSGGMTTAQATTGPARGPRPTSSTPAISGPPAARSSRSIALQRRGERRGRSATALRPAGRPRSCRSRAR